METRALSRRPRSCARLGSLVWIGLAVSLVAVTGCSPTRSCGDNCGAPDAMGDAGGGASSVVIAPAKASLMILGAAGTATFTATVDGQDVTAASCSS